MAPHAPAPNFHRYPVLRVFPVIQVNSEALARLSVAGLSTNWYYEEEKEEGAPGEIPGAPSSHIPIKYQYE
jgi:hypothetical protein